MNRSIAAPAALLLLALAGCSSPVRDADPRSTGPRPAEAQVLRFLTVNMPRSLDPVHIDAQRITNNGLAEPLVMPDDDATPRPWLATAWRSIEPTLWEFTLRPHVRFWSGAPMDARAVKASLERHQRENVRAGSVLRGWEFIAKDPLTLQVRTPKPDPSLPHRIAAYTIHNADAAARLGDRYNLEPDLTGWFKPIEFVPGELLIAEANQDYWGEQPKLRRIEGHLGSDPQTRLLALRAGDADAEFNVEIDQRLEYQQQPERFVTYSPAPSTRNIWMNFRKLPMLRDLRVRQALSLAVNRDDLIHGLNHGFATPATGHFPKGLPYSLEDGMSLDRGKAESLLDEAGWRRGPDGVRAKDGRKLEFKILTYSVFLPLAVTLQSQWKEIGIRTELTPVETTASNQLMYDGNFEIATYCSCGAATGDVAGQLRAFYRTGMVTNFGGYSNPDVDRLIDQLDTEFDASRQIDLARRIQTLVRDDVAIIYLYSSTQWGAAYSTSVRGIDPHFSRHFLPSVWMAR